MELPKPTLDKEKALYKQGFSFVAGIDEAGRGAWAGPVVAAAVILPPDQANLAEVLAPVNDSKQMSPPQRERAFDLIQTVAMAIGIGVGSHRCIDRRRIVAATRQAMARALTNLSLPPDYLLIDALPLPSIPLPQQAFPKADSISLSVAAASIIAKVSRDRLMGLLDQRYSGYQFARHKGYGTKAHQAALSRLGPCPIHRYSFAPIRALTIAHSPEAQKQPGSASSPLDE